MNYSIEIVEDPTQGRRVRIEERLTGDHRRVRYLSARDLYATRHTSNAELLSLAGYHLESERAHREGVAMREELETFRDPVSGQEFPGYREFENLLNSVP